MTTEVLTTGAVFDLVDRFSPTLDKLLGGLGRAEGEVKALQASLDRLGIGGLAGISTKFTAEWAKIGTATDKGVESVLKKMGRLGPESSLLFGEMTKGARTAFRDIGTEAGLAKDSVVDQMRNAGVFGSAALAEGIDKAAPGMFSPIVSASILARKEAMANLAGIGGAVEAASAKAQATGAGGALERQLWGDKTRARGSSFGRGPHGDGLHFGRVGGEVGGVHMSVGGNATLAVAGLALDGIYDMAQIDDVVARALATSQIPIGPNVSQDGAGKRIHDMIQNASKMTGFTFHEAGEGILEGQRLLNQMDFGKRNDLIEKIIPAAAYESRMKGSTLPEAIEAIIGIAHQTQTYDPAGIEKIAKSLAYTSILTPSPLPQFQTALGYSMPELHNGLDMDPSTIMLLTATMQQSGIKGTKSGTWLRSFFENSEPGNDEHNEALKKLGMLDASNKPSWRKTGADGKVDWQGSVETLSQILQRDQQTIPIDERIGLLRKAYGERGAGFASLMMGEKFTENLSSATRGMNSFKGGEDMLGQYASASILQQSRVALADFNVAMSDLGAKLMPAATHAVSDFSEIMRTFDKDGPQGFLKLFYERAIKPDVDPLVKHLGPGTNDLKFKDLDPTADPFGMNAARNGSQSPAVIEDRASRAKADDLTSPSLWHKIFGSAGDGAKDAGQKFGELSTRTGFVLTSFDTLKGGGGTLNTRFGELGTGSASLDGVFRLLEATGTGAARALASVALSGGGGGGVGGGSGFMNASYGGGSPDLSGAFRGAGPGIGHIFSAEEREKNIRTYSASIGIDPNVAMAVAKSEGFGRFDGDRGTSFGDLQMHVGGGLGDIYRRTTGRNPADPHNELDLDRFALDQAKRGGWAPWHGAAHIGVHGRYGMDYHAPAPAMPTVDGRRKVSPGAPAAGQTAEMPPIIINHQTVLDGKVIDKRSMKHLAQTGRFPTSGGGPDMHSHYSNPAGTPVTDAA